MALQDFIDMGNSTIVANVSDNWNNLRNSYLSLQAAQENLNRLNNMSDSSDINPDQGFYVNNASKGPGKPEVASEELLNSHYEKHGGEFRGAYNDAQEYLKGAQDVIENGIKVQYQYKGEIRTGYVKFMSNSSKGTAKFEFVGTNLNGDITTYHVESGKIFWKMLNGENVPVINMIE